MVRTSLLCLVVILIFLTMAKQARTNAKRALTMRINEIRQSLAESDLESYEDEVKALKDLFKNFKAK